MRGIIFLVLETFFIKNKHLAANKSLANIRTRQVSFYAVNLYLAQKEVRYSLLPRGYFGTAFMLRCLAAQPIKAFPFLPREWRLGLLWSGFHAGRAAVAALPEQ